SVARTLLATLVSIAGEVMWSFLPVRVIVRRPGPWWADAVMSQRSPSRASIGVHPQEDGSVDNVSPDQRVPRPPTIRKEVDSQSARFARRTCGAALRSRARPLVLVGD